MTGGNSILSRIVRLHVAAVGVTCIAMLALAWLVLNATTDQFEQQILRNHADTIARHLNPTANGWTLDLPEDLRAIYASGYGGFAFAVLDGPDHVLFSSLGGAPLIASSPNAAASTYFRERRGASVYYGATIPERRNGQTLWIEVAQDLEHPDVIFDDVLAGFLWRFGWVAIPLLLTLLAMDILSVRRAIRPVLDVSDRAKAIGPASLDLRLPTAGLPREILPLVNAVNRALDRLEQGFRLQRDFTADAAHELRTPLTLLQTHVETLVGQDAARPLRADIDHMSRILGQLLEIAELETIVIDPNEIADLRQVCVDVVSAVAPLAVAQGKEIELAGDPGPVAVRASQEAISRAVRNLVENAIRHTAPETAVEVCVTAGGIVSVRDHGPGIPESERQLVFRRFWRRDRARAGGAGLGLAIVERVAQAYRGTIRIEGASGSGAMFVLTLPLAR